MLAYPLLILAGAGVFLWFFPIHSRWLDDKVKRTLEEALGLRVEFGSGSCYLSRGLFQVRHLRLSLPKGAAGGPAAGGPAPGGSNELQCERAEARFTIRGLFFSSPRAIELLSIINPSEMEFAAGPGAPSFSPVLRALIEAIRKASSKPKPAPEGFVLEHGSIEGLRARAAFAGPDGKALGAIRLAGVALDFRQSNMDGDGEGGQIEVNLYGDEINGKPDRWRASVRYAPADTRLNYELALTQLTAPLSLDSVASAILTVERPRISGEITPRLRSLGDLAGTIELTANRAQVTGADGSRVLADEELEGNVDWRYFANDRRVEARRVTVRGEQTDLRLEGFFGGGRDAAGAMAAPQAASPAKPAQWEAILDVYQLPADLVRLAARRAKVADWISVSDRTRLRAQLDLAGSLSPTTVAVRLASLRMNDLATTIPNLELPIKDGILDVEYAPEGSMVRSLSGAVDGGTFGMSGPIAGDALRAGALKGDFLWHADVDLKRLVAAKGLSDMLRKSGMDVSGRVSALGRIQQEAKRLASGNLALLPPQIRADLTVTSGALSHPSLPKPVEDIEGTLVSEGSSLVISQLSGAIGEAEVDINGRVQGDRYFWIKPKLNLALSCDLAAADALAVLSPDVRQSAAKWSAAGNASIRATLTGDPSLPKELQAGAAIQLSGVSFRPPLDGFDHAVTGVEGNLVYDGQRKTFRAERLAGVAAGIPIECRGTIGQSGLSLNFTADLDLRKAQRAVPAWLKGFDVDGSVAMEACLRTGSPTPDLGVNWDGRNLSLPPLDFDSVFRQMEKARENAATPVPPATRDAPWPTTPSLWVSFRGQGFTFTHEDMPVALHNIRAEIFYIDGVFFAKDFVVDFGKSKDLNIRRFAYIVTGEPAGPAEPRGRLWFEAQGGDVDLEEWFQSWATRPRGSALELPEPWRPVGLGPDGRPRPDDKPSSWTTEIGGTVQARQARWRRHTIKDFGMSLSYHHTPALRNRFRADGYGATYGGTTTATIETAFGWDNVLRWQTRVNCAGVQAEPLLAAVCSPGTKANVNGRLSGLVELKGREADTATFQGTGRMEMAELKFVNNKILTLLGQVLSLGGLFNSATFDQMQTHVEVRDKKVFLPDFSMSSDMMKLDARGTVGFDQSLDVIATVNLFRSLSVLNGVPVLGVVTEVVGTAAEPFVSPVKQVLGKVLQAHLSGTLDKPRAVPAPFAGPPENADGATTYLPRLSTLTQITSGPLTIRFPNTRRPE